jgi:hypothetical protein
MDGSSERRIQTPEPGAPRASPVARRRIVRVVERLHLVLAARTAAGRKNPRFAVDCQNGAPPEDPSQISAARPASIARSP